MADPPADVYDRLERRTERILAELREAYDTDATVDPFHYGPQPWFPDDPPQSVEEQLETWAGIASVVPFYTDREEQVVLVWNRSGQWEPPGGVIEAGKTPAEMARIEAREETGLDVEITDLLYTGVVHYHYDEDGSVPLPVAEFVGRRTGGSLRVERERIAHPGATRGVGVFGPDVLPENCRDRERILEILPDEEEYEDEIPDDADSH